jgi:hypothetical protein
MHAQAIMLKKFAMLIFLFFIKLFFESSITSAQELKTGDVILISFNCYECKIIESETNSPFSHSGVILKTTENQYYVLQSLGSVISVPINDFLKNKRPLSKVSIYRPKDFTNFNKEEYIKLTHDMMSVFNRDFLGLNFDSKYLWDNFDQNGNELLYCSEFVSKFIDYFLSKPTIPYPMSYSKNYQYWLKYFNGNVPEGVLGNSPGSFANDPRFEFVFSF